MAANEKPQGLQRRLGMGAALHRSVAQQRLACRLREGANNTPRKQIAFALDHEALTMCQLAVKCIDEEWCFVAESSACRILKAADLFTAPDYVVIKAAEEFTGTAMAINEMCLCGDCTQSFAGSQQTDVTCFKMFGRGWYYPHTILDDCSRSIIASKHCTSMRAEDVTDTIALALTASGCGQAVVRHKPRLLRDNGSCYILGGLAERLQEQKGKHIHGAPFHPQTQGKIECWHQTMKNRVPLENHRVLADLERQIGAIAAYYSTQRYHKSLNNVTPADVHFGRDKAILREMEKIKKQTIRQRRL